MRPPTIVRIAVPRRDTPTPPTPRQAARALIGVMARCEALLAGQSPPAPAGLTGARLRVLAALPRRAASLARDLARQLDMDGGQLSRILAGLEHQGLIVRVAGANRRQSPVALTAMGRLALRRAGRSREDALERHLAHLTPDERIALGAALEKVEEIVSRL